MYGDPFSIHRYYKAEDFWDFVKLPVFTCVKGPVLSHGSTSPLFDSPQ
jgi:hypothetical protein